MSKPKYNVILPPIRTTIGSKKTPICYTRAAVYSEEVDSMWPDVNDFYNGARHWEQTYADCAMSMMVLSSTKVHPDNVFGLNYNNVQPTEAYIL